MVPDGPTQPASTENAAALTDAVLVQRCRVGDRQAFRFLYQRYQKRVRSTLYQLCGAATLDDLVQEVFLRVWRGLPALKRADQLSTWIYRITWNVAADQRRSFAQQRSRQQILWQQATPESTTDLGLTHLHYQDLVQQGLATLSFEHRTVLVLHDLEEIPQRQIAEALGIPTGTVKSRLFHARAAMRRFLEQAGVQV